MADRVFDAFEKLTPLDTAKLREMLEGSKTKADEEDQNEDENIYIFDPKRFKKDKLH